MKGHKIMQMPSFSHDASCKKSSLPPYQLKKSRKNGTSSWPQKIGPFHSGKHNFIYYDGHVGSYRYGEMPSSMETALGGDKLWYPRGGPYM
jgi:prepilin-type processing-associated H-X9-DG protein